MLFMKVWFALMLSSTTFTTTNRTYCEARYETTCQESKKVDVTLSCEIGVIQSASVGVGYDKACKDAKDDCVQCSNSTEEKCLSNAEDVTPEITSCNLKQTCSVTVKRQEMSKACDKKENNFIRTKYRCYTGRSTSASPALTSSIVQVSSTLPGGEPSTVHKEETTTVPEGETMSSRTGRSTYERDITTVRGVYSTIEYTEKDVFPWAAVGVGVTLLLVALVGGFLAAILLLRRCPRREAKCPEISPNDNGDPIYRDAINMTASNIIQEDLYQNEAPPAAMIGTTPIYGNEVGDVWQSPIQNEALLGTRTVQKDQENGNQTGENAGADNKDIIYTVPDGPKTRKKAQPLYTKGSLCPTDIYSKSNKSDKGKTEDNDPSSRTKPTVAVKPTRRRQHQQAGILQGAQENGKGDSMQDYSAQAYYNDAVTLNKQDDVHEVEFEMADNVIYDS